MVIKEIYNNMKKHAEGVMMFGVLTVLSVASLETILITKQGLFIDPKTKQEKSRIVYDMIEVKDFDENRKTESSRGGYYREREQKVYDFIFSP